MRYPFTALSIPLLGLLLMTPWPASAAPIVVFGTSSPIDATATGTLTASGGTTMNLSLTNTSPFDGTITGIGFDLFSGDFTDNSSAGLNGFAGTSSDAAFTFSDGALGNVPEFSLAVLDFGYTTGPSGTFSGGFPPDGIAPFQTINFLITGGFAGLTEDQLAAALFVRFQNLGADGEGSDVARVGVGTPNVTPNAATVPEPASMILLGTGLLAALRARKRHS